MVLNSIILQLILLSDTLIVQETSHWFHFVLTWCHKSLECGQSLSTGVTAAPPVILRTVNQVKVTISENGDGWETAGLGVRVHTFDSQCKVVIVRALIGLPGVVIYTVTVPYDACKKLQIELYVIHFIICIILFIKIIFVIGTIMTYVVNDMELQIKNWQHLIKSAGTVLIPFLSSSYVLIHNPQTKLGFYSKENQFPPKQLNTGT